MLFLEHAGKSEPDHDFCSANDARCKNSVRCREIQSKALGTIVSADDRTPADLVGVRGLTASGERDRICAVDCHPNCLTYLPFGHRSMAGQPEQDLPLGGRLGLDVDVDVTTLIDER